MRLRSTIGEISEFIAPEKIVEGGQNVKVSFTCST